MDGGDVIFSRAAGRLVRGIGRDELAAALVLILESGECHKVLRDAVVALVYELIAVADELLVEGIGSGVIHDGLAGDRVAVGSGDGDDLAEAVAEIVEVSTALLRPLVVLLALARCAVAEDVVEAVGGLVIDGAGEEELLILLRDVVGNVEEVPRAGYAGGGDAVVERAAHLQAGTRLPAKIGRGGAGVELVVGAGIRGLEPVVVGQVVERAVRAGNFARFMRGVEAARIAGEEE